MFLAKAIHITLNPFQPFIVYQTSNLVSIFRYYQHKMLGHNHHSFCCRQKNTRHLIRKADQIFCNKRTTIMSIILKTHSVLSISFMFVFRFAYSKLFRFVYFILHLNRSRNFIVLSILFSLLLINRFTQNRYFSMRSVIQTTTTNPKW